MSEGRSSRELPWPWPLHVFLLLIASFFVLMSFAWEGVDRFVAIALAIAAGGASAADLMTLRPVAFGPRGVTVGGALIPWSSIESHAFRELPRARAGLLLRLTEEARPRFLRRAGAHRGEDGEAYDIYLRAYGDRIVEWFELFATYGLAHSADQLSASVEPLQERMREAAPDAQLVTADPCTVSIHVSSLEQLASSAPVIARVLPQAARWDPALECRVMILVGPLQLGDQAGAGEVLEELKRAVAREIAGNADVEAIFAERRQPPRP